MTAKYVVGIDLGTTNSVVACAPLPPADEGDTRRPPDAGPQLSLLALPQLVAAGTVESLPSLPSFLYLPTAAEAASSACDLPWQSHPGHVCGEWARRQSAEIPHRTVGAAKSWLCHNKVDRRQPILPWGAPDEVPRVSPVVASQRYLEHLTAAWDAAHPDAPLAAQQVVLTVPASFDAGARELTREAAVAAGLPAELVLLEEPQAAVYAWLTATGDRWRRVMKVGDVLLVCDVGGGTTDLSLVQAIDDGQGELQLERLAVGNHLLLGGDNMDLALAHHAAEKFNAKSVQLDPWQSVSLWHACRAAKEKLLAADGETEQTIAIAGRGSRLVGGTLSTTVTRKAAAKLLTDGFFPRCGLDEAPVRRRASGFQEIGLPYEQDTAVTRHIAAFLTTHGGRAPTHVLFNGGVFQAEALRRRLMETLESWYPEQPPVLLPGDQDLNHAVALGAAAYGWSKRQGGVRIRGGTARSYYVGIETAGLAIPGAPRPLRALCVVPFGMEEGAAVDVPSGEIGLVVGETAQFRFFSSSTRHQDRPGDVLDRWSPEELQAADSLETLLPADESTEEPFLPVRFHAAVTELGMLELWCVAAQSAGRWKLEFSVREDQA